MANKNLFKSTGRTVNVPVAETVNKAGGAAYKVSDRHALAQIAATNCFNNTFYASAEDNLKLAKDAANRLVQAGDLEFIAKVAIYSRDKGYMKDMPAFLTVVLAGADTKLFHKVFDKVVDNGKMLRNVMQMARSGALGRKFNMSSKSWKRAIQRWFDSRNSYQLFKASIGNNPSMREILSMAHPRPNSEEKSALFSYFYGNKVEVANLPEIVREYEMYKLTKSGTVPNVDFRMLDALGLGDKQWAEIASNAPWMMTRMNLNTFARHNVFKDKKVTEKIVKRLKDPQEIAKARAFPYQLYVAYREVSKTDGVPNSVQNSLQDAMEIAIDNVPVIPGKGYVCVDSSGSMSASITGNSGYGRPQSSISCADVAGLIASAVVRKNEDADVYTFDTSAKKVQINPRDTVFTNAQKLNRAGGGTSISVPLRDLNAQKAKGDWVFYVSDNESWADRSRYGGGTALAEEWAIFKKRNPKARLILCDLIPNVTAQVKEDKDILRVGGFSDQVFNVVASFVEHGPESDHWLSEIEKISLD